MPNHPVDHTNVDTHISLLRTAVLRIFFLPFYSYYSYYLIPLSLQQSFHLHSLVFSLKHGSAYVLAFSPEPPLTRRPPVTIDFDTQSPQYRREAHGFFIPLLLAGHILLPISIVAAHLSKNRFSRSPILMNFCYANVGYCTSFLMS